MQLNTPVDLDGISICRHEGEEMLRLLAYSGLVLGTLCLSSCGRPVASDPTPEENARISPLGEATAKNVFVSLGGALTRAMSGGVENAITVCNEEALDMTANIADDVAGILEIKRTSFKIRNPTNAPDKFEEKALRYFEDAFEETGQVPDFYTQKITSGDDVHYRYYKPMRIGGLCIACHGRPEFITESVREHLARYYPEDEAVGYDVGDFRGVIRVSIVGK